MPVLMRQLIVQRSQQQQQSLALVHSYAQAAQIQLSDGGQGRTVFRCHIAGGTNPRWRRHSAIVPFLSDNNQWWKSENRRWSSP